MYKKTDNKWLNSAASKRSSAKFNDKENIKDNILNFLMILIFILIIVSVFYASGQFQVHRNTENRGTINQNTKHLTSKNNSEPDFGPYMRELQKRIKRNWNPPRGNISKRVVILFKVRRDGRLLSVKILNSSGLPEADEAAIRAVQLSAPFRPLPEEHKGNDVSIQFTFDYNVFKGINKK